MDESYVWCSKSEDTSLDLMLLCQMEERLEGSVVNWQPPVSIASGIKHSIGDINSRWSPTNRLSGVRLFAEEFADSCMSRQLYKYW